MMKKKQKQWYDWKHYDFNSFTWTKKPSWKDAQYRNFISLKKQKGKQK